MLIIYGNGHLTQHEDLSPGGGGRQFVAALQHEGESISFAVDGIEKGSLGMLTAVVGLPQ